MHMPGRGFQGISISDAYFISIFIRVVRNWRLTTITSAWNHLPICSKCGRGICSATRLLIILVFGMPTVVWLFREESVSVLMSLHGLLVKSCRLFRFLTLKMNYVRIFTSLTGHPRDCNYALAK